MKQVTLLLLIACVVSCTNPLDRKLNIKEFEKVKEIINSNNNYSTNKRKFIVDNLDNSMGLVGLVKVLNADKSELPTFRQEIEDYSKKFDSILEAKTTIAANNKKILDFIEVVDVNSVSSNKYEGHLHMSLRFNNNFEKEVLYIILNYKYVDEYDSQFFNESRKLTDEIAENFKEEVDIYTTEEYNDVAKFLYTKVPTRARKSLRDKLGEEAADKKVHRDFLMKGLLVEAELIVFKDKSELSYQNADWEYLE